MPALVVDGVAKRFSLPVDRVQTLKERALHPIRSSERKQFEALHDLSFQIEKGEFFGLVGRNGSGKSTLLKCIAGIYRTDEGAIYHDGTVTSFIELGVGFNPELAALDNVAFSVVKKVSACSAIRICLNATSGWRGRMRSVPMEALYDVPATRERRH